MLRTLLVDDEPLARSRLRAMLGDHADVAIVGECEDAVEAIRAIRAEKPDLVFLDIQMPGFDAFQALDAVRVTPMPAIVFVTAHPHHAVRAFEADAVDYLLKPYDEERLARALDRVRAAVAAGERNDLSADLRALVDRLQGSSAHRTRVAVTLGRRTLFVNLADVTWIEASGNYLRLHVGGSYHLLRSTIGAFEKELDPARFVRIHRSVIVQIDQVRELRTFENGESKVLLADGTELPMSRAYRDRLPRP